MTKIANLTLCLVEKHGVTLEDAEFFVSEMLAIIRERIETDKQVKIKGLGTFKLAEMSARESVDINTGERILIEGKYKLSFTPENAVRDRINAPFAQFESVDIDDDIDFSAIDNKYSESEEEIEGAEDSIEETKTEVVNKSVTETNPIINTSESVVLPTTNEVKVSTEGETKEIEVVDENNTIECNNTEDNIVEETAEEPASVENITINNSVEEIAIEEQTEVKPTEEVALPLPTQEAEVVEQPNNQTNKISNEQPTTVRSPYCEDLIREGITHSRKIMRMLYTLLVLVVISLLIFAGYFCYQIGINAGMKKSSAMHADVVKTKNEMLDSKTTTSDAAKAVETKKDSVKAENHKIEVIKTEQAKAEPVKTETQKEKSPVIPDQSKYNEDARVRTGAYVIMGLDTTVTVQKGQTFTSICKAYLGEGMECYVEVFNNGMKEAKAGDKIKIPKLKLKKLIKK